MKRLAILLLIFVAALNMGIFSVCAADDFELIINGEKQIYEQGVTAVHLGTGNNQMLAPARDISAALGADYAQSDQCVTLTKEDCSIIFTMDVKKAQVNGSDVSLEAPPQLIGETPFIPVEFCGNQFGYHVLREKAGKRVRIVSNTGTAAPAVSENVKPGMAELYSTVHRPVPTRFEKSNELTVDNLIYCREDYSDTVKNPDPSEIGALPTGPIIFSQDDFLYEMNHYADWIKNYIVSSTVDTTPSYRDGRITMKVKMAGQSIGEGNNMRSVPFSKAIRLVSKYKPKNPNSSAIVFSKRLPSPTKSDKYVLTYYARLISGGNPDFGTGKVQVIVQGDSDEQSTHETVEFKTEWKRFDFLLTGAEGATQIRFLTALEAQTIEIGGFEIRNVGEDADISYFTQTKVDLLPQELAVDAAWRAEALDRIEKVRKGDFKVVVQDASGNPVPGAKVTFDMFEHEFKFGVTMDLEYVSDDLLKDYVVDGNGDKEKEFVERIGSNFNALSVGNRLKWNYYAKDKMNNPDKPSTASLVINEAKKQGLKYVRGHALWMPSNSYIEDPQEMYDLLTDTRSTDERYTDLLGLLEDHFSEMNEKFPEIYEWDVTNETHGRTFFTDVFGMQIFNDIYEIAARQLTNGQKLMLCDNRQFEDPYWERLDWFKEQGIQYDALGMQGHARIGSKDPDNNYRPTKWLEVWDRFAYEYQKTFAVTEFSVGALRNEYGYEGQGDYLRDILIAAFSHPACTGFNIWWLSDYWSEWDSPFRPDNPANNQNGAGVAPLYTLWFDEKPGLKIYQDLLYNKWWTRGEMTITDASGAGEVRGFYGDYDVTVTVDGREEKTVMAAFHKGYENVLTITLD